MSGTIEGEGRSTSRMSHETQDGSTIGLIPPAGSTSRRKSFLHHLPSFKDWILDTWLDLLVLICVGIASLVLHLAPSASTREFPIIFSDGVVVYPTLAYPRHDPIIPIWLAALLAVLGPTIFFVLAQIWVKSFYDLYVAFFGNVWAVATSTLFQVLVKTLIGGFRPYFLSVCNPDLSRVVINNELQGQGFQKLMFDTSICSRDADHGHMRDAVKSFPSGHTATAAGGFVFLALYFNAKMKIFSDRRPQHHTLLLFCLPLLAVVLVAGTLTIDNSHHWYDVVGGGLIGVAGAFASFRVSYMSVWDWRDNHVPLPRLEKDRGWTRDASKDLRGWQL